jgi:DNA polymerase-3 subunit delta'
MTSAYETLTRSLVPWLEPAFERFEEARSREHLGHAWLLAGPAGMGKINLALALAERLLGTRERPTALAADAALAAMRERHTPADRHPDLHWLHPEEDKETISVEQVRGIIESLGLTAHRGATKVVIIEPAEAMTAAAANALLKTLEEPTANSYLLLVTHRPGRLPATIRSRCQQINLRPPSPDELSTWLGGVRPDAVVEAQALVGRSALGVAHALRETSIDINSLEDYVIKISEDRLDVQTLAQAWGKEGPDAPLSWLCGRLHEALRARLAPRSSTEVTVPLSATLHNAWRGLSTRTLVEVYDRSEKLLNQLGSGINVELAIQALLSALQTNRGRS